MSLAEQAKVAARDATDEQRDKVAARRVADMERIIEKIRVATRMDATIIDAITENVPALKRGGIGTTWVDRRWLRVQLDDVILWTSLLYEDCKEPRGDHWYAEVTCASCQRPTPSGIGAGTDSTPAGQLFHAPLWCSNVREGQDPYTVDWRDRQMPEFIRNIGAALTWQGTRLCSTCFFDKPSECHACGRKDRS